MEKNLELVSNPKVNVRISGNNGYEESSCIYKTKILGANDDLLFEMKDTDTKYVIKYDFNLNAKVLHIPDRCILEFSGGSINNGYIIINGAEVYPLYNNLLNGNMLVVNGFPKEGSMKWSSEYEKPLWSTGLAWVDALGNDPSTQYSVVSE